MNKHKYYDVIVAWASGEKIQYKFHGETLWEDYGHGVENGMIVPAFNDSQIRWRIKPKTVTKRYRMALVLKNLHIIEYDVISVDVTGSSIDDPAEYNVAGFVRWVGDIVEVEIEVN